MYQYIKNIVIIYKVIYKEFKGLIAINKGFWYKQIINKVSNLALQNPKLIFKILSPVSVYKWRLLV